MENVIVTCISTLDYLYGVLCLNEQIHKLMGKRLYVVCTLEMESKCRKLFANMGIRTILVPDIELPEDYINSINNSDLKYWKNTFIKLSIFRLTEFQKILYLDSDMLLTKDVTDVFEYDCFCAVDDGDFMMTGQKEGINSGFMLIKPDEELYQLLVKNICKVAAEKRIFGDQDVIQYTYKNIEQKRIQWLSIMYNANAYKLDIYAEEVENKVIHFISSNKPWNWNMFYAFIRIMSYKLKNRNKTYKYVRMYYEMLFKLKRKYRIGKWLS